MDEELKTLEARMVAKLEAREAELKNELREVRRRLRLLRSGDRQPTDGGE